MNNRLPCVLLTSKIVKFFTKIRDQREQAISTERQLVLVGGPAALCELNHEEHPLVRGGQQVRRFEHVFTDLLVPPRCARCGTDLPGPTTRSSILLCEECKTQLTEGGDRFCERCGAIIPLVRGVGSACYECARTRFRFDSVVVLGPYRDALREAVLTMKRPAGEPLSAAMAHLLVAKRNELITSYDGDCVIPVPMYWGRKAWRGTNSAQILAEEIARRMALPLLNDAITRTRNTLPQKDLAASERFRNVRRAFALRGGYCLKDKRVLIVDDILTTGATCSEVARTLKRSGAAAVAAAVVGRAGVSEKA